MSHLSVTYQPPDLLNPYRNNPRVHSKAQLGQIQDSIRAFGFTNPILVDEANAVIAGHGRLLAAKALGMSEVPTIQIAGLSEARKAALRIADNKIALNSSWDLDLLKVEIQSIEALDVSLDLTVTGFATGEIDVTLGEGDSPDEDVIPEVLPAAVTCAGDIWRLGAGHRVGCGDSRNVSFLRELVGEGLVDAAFLDVPYNVKVDGHAGGKGRVRHREFAMASGEMSKPEFTRFLDESLRACSGVSRNGAVHFVCIDHHHIDELSEAGRGVYGARLNICVWAKSNAGMGSLYRSQHELVFVYRVGEAPHSNNVQLGRHGRNRTNIWRYDSVNTFKGSRRQDLALHPTVKPAKLVADALMDVTHRGDLVLDAFLGSGTTLVACERLGRRCRGVDIDPLYVDLALRRWAELAGDEPRLEATGEAFTQVEQRRRREGQP